MAIRSSIENLHAYVPGEQPSSSAVLKLNTNENPYPASPRVMEALASMTPENLRKYPDPSGKELREALASSYGCSAENFIVVNGSDEGLALCTRCFCEHGGTVGYMSPSYSLYPVLADIAELKKVEFPLDETFAWSVPERVEVDLFFLTRPNAPTSLSLPVSDVEALCKNTDGIVVVDEAYAAFASDSLMDKVGKIPNLLVSRTFSKSHSLAGLRVGYLAGPAHLIAALHKIRDSYNLDAIAQKLALAALKDEPYTRDLVQKVHAVRSSVTSELEQMCFSVLPSQTNFLFAKVPPHADAQEIFEKLKAKDVYIRYFPGPITGDYLRITIGTDAQMSRFLSELQEVL